MNNETQISFDNMGKPWGKLFYKMLWHQIGDLKDLKIVDFGSGFGITSNHYSLKNVVVAIEPNEDILKLRVQDYNYIQEVGSVEKLRCIGESSVDYIFCHNIFEYVKNYDEILIEFMRILKPKGTISIVKHNRVGRVMQKVVFENNIDEALKILDGKESKAQYYGTIRYYNIEELISRCEDLEISEYFGIRTFWALQQNNEMKFENQWEEKMFEIECRVFKQPEFREVAFYHHVLLRKN